MGRELRRRICHFSVFRTLRKPWVRSMNERRYRSVGDNFSFQLVHGQRERQLRCYLALGCWMMAAMRDVHRTNGRSFLGPGGEKLSYDVAVLTTLVLCTFASTPWVIGIASPLCIRPAFMTDNHSGAVLTPVSWAEFSQDDIYVFPQISIISRGSPLILQATRLVSYHSQHNLIRGNCLDIGIIRRTT